MLSQEFQDGLAGLADYVEYESIKADGVMLGKGGQLIGGFLVRGDDQDSATNAELAYLSDRLNAALIRFGSGWMTHADIIRFEAKGYQATGEFEHPLPRMVDQERARKYNSHGKHYESMYGLIVTYVPPLQAESKMRAMMFESSADLRAKQDDLQKKLVQRFDAILNEVQRDLSLVYQAGVQRMKQVHVKNAAGEILQTYDQLVEYCHFCVTGIKQIIQLPRNLWITLDAIIGSQDFTGGNTPRVGRNHIRTVVIEGFPMQSHATILAELDQLPMGYRWSNRFIYFDPDEGRNILDSIRKKWKQKVRGFKDQYANTQRGPVDEDAKNMERQAVQGMGFAASGYVRYGHYTSVVVVMSESAEEADYNAGEVEKLIRGKGFACRIETVNTVEAYFGSLPGHGYENVRRPIVNTVNLGHYMPVTALWQGLETNPCPFYPPNSPPLMSVSTTGSTPMRFGYHVGDVGHSFIGGPNGSGKSTLLNLSAIQHLRYKNAKIRGVDKGRASFIPCNASGGAFYDLGQPEEGMGFCPLKDVDDPNERDWAEDWLEMVMELQKMPMTGKRRKTVRAALQRLAETKDKNERTMTHFVSVLQDEELKDVFRPLTLEGDNTLLDAPADSFEWKPWTMFEIGELFDAGPLRLVPTMLYIMHQIELDLDGSPTLIPLDEGWLLLDHPVMREWLKKWLKTLRKSNAAVLFTTQNISDVGNSSIADVIFENCFTKIFLANKEAKNPDMKKNYSTRGLNDRQIELIAKAVPKRDYYYTSPLGKRTFQLGIDENSLTMAIVGAGGKHDIAAARKLMRAHGDRWVVHWLRERGLKNYAEELDAALS
ncbi:transporter [Herbaspirillum huttiense]|uniref:VirB4 family type IV secretion/conjugal transfer ATPase n=1 Tax=Herbaspirillum huttiense TaxID=863372 RepID=UPI0037FDC137